MSRKEQDSACVGPQLLPIEVTARTYREGVEAILRPFLDDPGSVLMQRLEAGEPAFINAGDVEENPRLIPIALPIKFKENGGLRKEGPWKSHNIAMVYLNKAYRVKEKKIERNGTTIVINEVEEIDESLKKIGDDYGFTRERARQLKDEAFRDAHQRSESSDIPVEYFETGKYSTDASKDRQSASGSGLTLRIKQMIDDGADYATLRANFTIPELARARKALSNRNHKVDVPKSPDDRSWGDIMAVLTDPGIDRIVKRELIKEITASAYQSYSKPTRKFPSSIFVDISEVAIAASYHKSNRNGETPYIAGYLAQNGLPVGYAEQVVKNGKQKGIRPYRFILAQDFDEAVEILREAKGERFDEMRKSPASLKEPKPKDFPEAA